MNGSYWARRIILSYSIFIFLTIMLSFFVSASLFGNMFGSGITAEVVSEGTKFTNNFKCNDTDGGFFSVVKGQVNYTSGSRIRSYLDICKGDKIVLEWYCDNGKPKNQNVRCNGVCNSGACAYQWESQITLYLGKVAQVDFGSRVFAVILANISSTSPGSIQLIFDEFPAVNVLDLDTTEAKPFWKDFFVHLVSVSYNKNDSSKSLAVINIRRTTPYSENATTDEDVEKRNVPNKVLRCVDFDGGKNYSLSGRVVTYDEDGSTVIANVTEFCLDKNRLLEMGCSRKEGQKDNFPKLPGFSFGSTPGFDSFPASVMPSNPLLGGDFNPVDPIGLFGDDKPDWKFAPFSTRYSLIRVKAVKCKDGCLNGACMQKEKQQKKPEAASANSGKLNARINTP